MFCASIFGYRYFVPNSLQVLDLGVVSFAIVPKLMFKSIVCYRVILSWNSQRGRLLSYGFLQNIYIGFIP